ncbi:MAG: hypothetical protein R3350_08550 [Saprospiraceae bacterium]|nr:hypothetical protein [Saprospiraceae bacterium]
MPRPLRSVIFRPASGDAEHEDVLESKISSVAVMTDSQPPQNKEGFYILVAELPIEIARKRLSGYRVSMSLSGEAFIQEKRRHGSGKESLY